jgi:MscS family membrane protein
MNSVWRKVRIAALLASLAAGGVSAQIPKLLTPPGSSSTANGKPSAPTDMLGRETPHGTTVGFLRAAQDGNYSAAIQYFQPAAGRHRPSIEEEQELASQLLAVLNQKFLASTLDTISRDPQGRLDDGLPADVERVRPRSESDPFSVDLVRQEDVHGSQLWYISRKTLEEVPGEYDSLRFPRIEKSLPRFLVEQRALAMPLWQWAAIILYVPVAIGIAWIIVVLLRQAWKVVLRARHAAPPSPSPTRWVNPWVLLFATLVHYQFVALIGTSILYRQYYGHGIWVLLAFAFYWGLTQVTRAISRRIGSRLMARGHMAERSLVSLVRRVLDVTIFVFVALIVLSSLGVNVTAALAGLGIGGLAIGLGAQKTFENLLGGISILSDKALQVGDSCKIGDQTGTVEDIGLRSTKIRTENRTLVSIPNGTVATATLENFRLRDKILCRQTVRLRYDLSPDHVRYSLERVRDTLREHPKVENSTARVRLLKFSEYSIDVEIYCYILERDYTTFLAIQEDLLLEVMATLDKCGASIALPSQTTIVNQDQWVDPDKAKAAEAAIEKQRNPGVPGTRASGA